MRTDWHFQNFGGSSTAFLGPGTSFRVLRLFRKIQVFVSEEILKYSQDILVVGEYYLGIILNPHLYLVARGGAVG